MDNNLNRFNLNISTGRVSPLQAPQKPKTQQPIGNDTPVFRDILSEQLAKQDSSVTFSKHAINRIEQRNIDVSADKVERLNHGIELAQQKGLNDVLVLVDKTAFIVNAQNRAVITTMGDNEALGNVFTNIDGTVIV